MVGLDKLEINIFHTLWLNFFYLQRSWFYSGFSSDRLHCSTLFEYIKTVNY